MGWCCGDPGDCLHLDKVAEDWRHTSHHSTTLDEQSDFFILSYIPDHGGVGQREIRKANLHSHFTERERERIFKAIRSDPMTALE